MRKWWIIPTAIFGTLFLAIGALYLTIMDTDRSDFKPKNISTEDVLRRQLVRSFSDIEETKAIEYKLNQDTLNQLLYNATESIRSNPQISSYVGDFYVKISGKHYTFYVDADLKVIKSRVIISTTLTESRDKSKYIFKINNIKLGNFPAKWIVDATGILKNLDLDQTFADMNLHIKSDIDNLQLTYEKSQMEQDVLDFMSASTGTTGDQSELFRGAIETFKFNFNFNNGISMKTDLSSFVSAPGVSDSRYQKNNSTDTSNHYQHYTNARNKIDSIMSNYKTRAKAGAGDDELNDIATSGFAELINEYGNTTDNVNKIVENRLIAVTNPVTAFPLNTEVEAAYITEGEIDAILRATDIIGRNYVLHFGEDVAYIVIDNMFCDLFTKHEETGFEKQYLNFSVGVNINGLETLAVIETRCDPIPGTFKASFTIENIYFGSQKGSDKFVGVVKNFFKDAVNPSDPSESEKAWVSYDGFNDAMIVDFDKLLDVIEDPTVREIFNNLGTRSFTVDRYSNTKLEDEGRLSILFTRTQKIPYLEP